MSLIRNIALALITVVSVLLIVFNFESVAVPASVLPAVALRQGTSMEIPDVLTVTIKRGSEAYYCLEESRALLAANVRDASLAMQAAVQATAEPSTTKDTLTRGILVFLPTNNTRFDKEFKAMFLSIAIMRLNEPSHIKTDVIVATA